MSSTFDDPQPPAGRRAWGWLIVGAVLLLAAGIFVAVDVRRYLTVSEITLPDLVGLPHDQATALLRREGLDPVTFVEHVSGLAAEVVSSQAPDAGTVVKRGRSVHLGVNTPPAEARIPDLVGLQQKDAMARAAELNLPVETISFEPSDRSAGRVIAQAPAGGERLGDGRALELVVSSGTERPDQTMPELAGMNVEDAAVQLHALGFRVVERLPSAVSFSEPGAVVASVPPAGAAVATSTPVILQYALSTANVVAVPEVVGLPQWRAQLALRAAQLQLGEVTYVQDPSRPLGVIDAKPTGYTLPGTPVLLTVNGQEPSPLFPGGDFQGTLDDLTPGGRGTLPGSSVTTPGGGVRGGTTPGAIPGATPGTTSGPAAGTMTADGGRQVPFSFDPTNMGVRRLLEEAYELRVVVMDERGERDVFDRRLQAGQSVSTTFVIYGSDVMLQTYIDGVFFQAWRP